LELVCQHLGGKEGKCETIRQGEVRVGIYEVHECKKNEGAVFKVRENRCKRESRENIFGPHIELRMKPSERKENRAGGGG